MFFWNSVDWKLFFLLNFQLQSINERKSWIILPTYENLYDITNMHSTSTTTTYVSKWNSSVKMPVTEGEEVTLITAGYIEQTEEENVTRYLQDIVDDVVVIIINNIANLNDWIIGNFPPHNIHCHLQSGVYYIESIPFL